MRLSLCAVSVPLVCMLYVVDIIVDCVVSLLCVSAEEYVLCAAEYCVYRVVLLR